MSGIFIGREASPETPRRLIAETAQAPLPHCGHRPISQAMPVRDVSECRAAATLRTGFVRLLCAERS